MRKAELLPRARARLRPRDRYREYSERTRNWWLQEQYARWRKRPVLQHQVMYESFSGNGMLCNPEAIFRALLAAPDMEHLEHVWALDDLGKHPRVLAEFAENPRVRFVQVKSPEYLEALARSKYLFNNATFPAEFAKREEQVYVNTWHGIPLKRMGYDGPEGGPGTRNVLRNLVNADYILSASEYMTDVMYRHAFRLQGIYRGTLIEEGQPRLDRQLEAQADPRSVAEDLEQRGVPVGNRKIILFAPTWKGASFDRATVNVGQLVKVVRELQSVVDSSAYVVLLKVHQVIYDAVRELPKYRDILVPNDLPTNSLLGATHVLVTDYSSIFFDFLATGRPVLHYLSDLDEYASERGLYLHEEDLWGARSHDIDELAGQLQKTLADRVTGEVPDRYRKAAAVYTPHDDGRVSERVIDIVFRGNHEGYRLRRDFGTSKKTMLIYLGAMTSNGLTTSALNLLRNLDYDRFDVSVLYHFSRQRDRAKNEKLIDSRCRFFARIGNFVGSTREVRAAKAGMERGLPSQPSKRHEEFWRTEWHRCFGSSRFDYALDLSGYGTFAPYLFLAGDIDTRCLWLHSDLMAESERETVGEKHLLNRLNAVFSTFPHFDRLVSVSKQLHRVNSQKLAHLARPDSFTFASNTIDYERVLRMAGRWGEAADEVGRDRPPTALPALATDNLAADVATLLEYYDPKAVLSEVRSHLRVRRSAPSSHGSAATFVSVGRLSPEKNHARLIRAFSEVHEHFPDTRLVILGGGKLEDELRSLIESLGLQDYVSLAGQVDNPYVIMADSDCFVMSSNYEGQPMVVLEARTLGLPIVTTAFDSVEGSVPPEAGIVVPHTDEALADGMRRFLRGEVPAAKFDYEAYNREAMREFYAAIAAVPSDQPSPPG